MHGSVTEPLLITGLENIFAEKSELSQATKHFNDKFVKSSLRETEGRAELALKGESQAKVIELRNRIILPTAILKLTPAGEKIVGPSAFGIAKGKSQVNQERGRAVTLRWVASGTRQFFCADASKIKEFMETNGLTTGLTTPQASSSASVFFSGSSVTVFGRNLFLCLTVGRI